MKITAVALSLAVAAAAGGTSMVTQSDDASVDRGELRAMDADSQRDSRVCRWLARSDSNSTVRLWFACRG